MEEIQDHMLSERGPFRAVSVRVSSGLNSFSLLIVLNNFIKHHACPKITITCCLTPGFTVDAQAEQRQRRSYAYAERR